MKYGYYSLIAVVLYLTGQAVLRAGEYDITVYKTPTCGCCKEWISHLEENQFQSKAIDMNDLYEVKSKFGISGQYRSCHTGLISTEQGDFVFEGHVPAKHIKTFLENPPEDALGLSVPGMPIGSPGMEVGDRKDYYQVLVIFKDGSSQIYAHENQPETHEPETNKPEDEKT